MKSICMYNPIRRCREQYRELKIKRVSGSLAHLLLVRFEGPALVEGSSSYCVSGTYDRLID